MVVITLPAYILTHVDVLNKVLKLTYTLLIPSQFCVFYMSRLVDLIKYIVFHTAVTITRTLPCTINK